MDIFLLLKTWTKLWEKNMAKNLTGKYCQILLDYVRQSATDALKTASKK